MNFPKNEKEIYEQLNQIEKEMENSDFWEDKQKAQEKIKKYEELKKEVNFFSQLNSGNAIMSIVSGAGGDDAEDFSKMLFHMYLKFIQKKGWGISIIHENKNDFGGYRNITFEVIGKNAYGTLKYESGVHRLVRISPFNAKKMRHTSFSLVEVLPEIKIFPIKEIPENEIKIEFLKSSGPGGQNVNKRETAVRVVHIPTGISVCVSQERSQVQNKEKALEILKSKIFKMEQEKGKEFIENLKTSKGSDIEWGNQIRSYVLHPYKLVKDHRTGVEENDIEKVLFEGDLEKFIEAEKLM